MKKYGFCLLLLLFFSPLWAQKIPDNFKLEKIIQARDLLVGHPNAVLMSGDLKHLIISYDHQPTYLHVYETVHWERVNQIEVSGALYLGQSYMDCEQPELLYGDYGHHKPKFYGINILSDYKEKIKPKDLPTATCGYAFVGKSKLREQVFRIQDRFILVVNYPQKAIQVFVKKIKRT